MGRVSSRHRELALRLYSKKGTHPTSTATRSSERWKQLGTDGLLKALGTELDICRLALDYCLKYTVHDAPWQSFKINVIINGTKG